MTDEPNSFESWGAETGASEPTVRSRRRRPRSLPSLRLRSAIPTGRFMPFVLIVLIAGAGAAVGAELTRSGPFASAAAPAPARQTLASAPAAAAAARPQTPDALRRPDARDDLPRGTWSWQLVASGTETGGGGGADVRAWDLSQSCDGGGCRLQLAREILTRSAPDGATDRATVHLLGELPRGGSQYSVQFAPVATSCSYRQGGAWRWADTWQRDAFVLDWVPSADRLGAIESSTITGCPGGVARDYERWSIERVFAPQLPALLADGRHARSIGAFRAAAGRSCVAMNAQLEPYAQRIVADRAVLRSASASAAAKARADNDIANSLEPLVAIGLREYTQTPQPPRGGYDRLWLRDIALQRSVTASAAALLAATGAAARDASAYLLTRNPLDAQRAAAEIFLVANDVQQLAGPGQASNTIEQDRLRLPSSCLDSPAGNEIFSAPTALAA